MKMVEGQSLTSGGKDKRLPNTRVVQPVYPKPREREMGSKGKNDWHILNFDNCASIRVR